MDPDLASGLWSPAFGYTHPKIMGLQTPFLLTAFRRQSIPNGKDLPGCLHHYHHLTGGTGEVEKNLSAPELGGYRAALATFSRSMDYNQTLSVVYVIGHQ
jgi:hypothetical protein